MELLNRRNKNKKGSVRNALNEKNQSLRLDKQKIGDTLSLSLCLYAQRQIAVTPKTRNTKNWRYIIIVVVSVPKGGFQLR